MVKPSQSSLSTDEALARALQNEYEQEYRSSQERPPPTAPSSNRAQGTSARMPTSTEKEDAAYARRLEREMRAQEANSGGVERSSTRSTQPTSSRSSSRDGSNQTGNEAYGNLTADEAYARRVEQEYEDEQVARQISSQEEQRASRQRATAVAAATPSRGPVRRLCGFIIPMAVIGGIAAGLYYLFAGGGNNIPGFIPDNWSDFAQEDPFNQTTPEQADRWRNNGNGLSLEIVNALDDKWYSYFYQAISDWDAGNPDVLSLSTSVRSPDSTGECASLDGKIKVCNFDYGPTNWRGINQVLIRNDVIFASSAKMNDYYLSDNNKSQKQYTMCHEVGHGFGLPHTDENFYNSDLGECMDYTSNPQNNLKPGSANFEFLAALYGTIPGQSVEASSSVPGKRNRDLESEDESLPDWLRLVLQEVIPNLENRNDGNEHEDGWRLLHRSDNAATHKMDLGDGYTVEVTKLLVNE